MHLLVVATHTMAPRFSDFVDQVFAGLMKAPIPHAILESNTVNKQIFVTALTSRIVMAYYTFNKTYTTGKNKTYFCELWLFEDDVDVIVDGKDRFSVTPQLLEDAKRNYSEENWPAVLANIDKVAKYMTLRDNIYVKIVISKHKRFGYWNSMRLGTFVPVESSNIVIAVPKMFAEKNAMDLAVAFMSKHTRFITKTQTVNEAMRLCAFCRRPSCTYKCGGVCADKTRYCSTECRDAHWPSHKALCGKL